MASQNLFQEVIDLLPYSPPFKFVDELLELDDTHVVGTYTYKEDEYFYKGHFVNYPLTPGVILVETMAQIGLVSLGFFLHLSQKEILPNLKLAFTSADVNFVKKVHPGEKVWVYSEKLFFRMGKLKCKVEMKNEEGAIVCKGELAGMILK